MPDLFCHVREPYSDLLVEKLQRNYDLTRVRSIGGAAQVWLILHYCYTGLFKNV